MPEVQLLLDSKELCELDKPKMLSNLTGLDRSSEVAPEDSPKSDRAYEFCEIYIPEPNSKEKPILVQTGFRRTTCKLYFSLHEIFLAFTVEYKFCLIVFVV